MNFSDLVEKSKEIRRLALESIYHAQSGHPGGVLSCADIVAYIYDQYVDLNNKDRLNRFVLSKGHAVPVLYAAAAVEGLIKKEELAGLRKLGSPLQGHPHVLTTDWVETSTGSLGQGFSAAIGMALAKSHKQEDGTVFVMLGDGELQEGEVWEGALFAAHYKMGNLCTIIDYNKMQSDDLNENIIGLSSLKEKWSAFNWNVIEIDGHSFEEIAAAFKSAEQENDRPTVLIANTIKGKGVSYMEGVPAWHGSVALQKDELDQALLDLK